MVFKFGKLLGRIKELYGTNSNFCKEIPISEKSFSDKINSKKDFKVSEIIRMIELLKISKYEIPDYFFDYHVQ